jgi:hypothetical protein
MAPKPRDPKHADLARRLDNMAKITVFAKIRSRGPHANEQEGDAPLAPTWFGEKWSGSYPGVPLSSGETRMEPVDGPQLYDLPMQITLQEFIAFIIAPTRHVNAESFFMPWISMGTHSHQATAECGLVLRVAALNCICLVLTVALPR